MVGDVIRFLKMNEVEYKENSLLALVSPVKIGGYATLIAFPDNTEKLIKLSCFLDEIKYRYKILGRMSNVLMPDKKYDGLVIRTDRMRCYELNGDEITVSAGASLPYIALLLQRCGLSGFERLSGIPGSIGGGIVGNAGAFGSEISHALLSVAAYIPRERCVVHLKAEECGFSYRNSVFKSGEYILLSAEFRLVSSDPVTVMNEMTRCRELRLASQPTDMPSLGSSFKRPSADYSAAYLIDNCGLKGKRIGGAQISEKHAGFIINVGGATAKDYIALLDLAADSVLKKYSVHLEREVEIV